MTTTQAGIDWLSITIPQGEKYAPSDFNNFGTERGKGMFGYTHVYDMPDGRIVMQNPDRPDMGTHIQYTGQSLAEIYQQKGMTGLATLRWHGYQAHKATRVDLAMDVHNGFTVHDVIAQWEMGNIETPMRKTRKVINMGEPGGTMYLGAKGADRIVRVYDKGAETGQNTCWTRIEAQFRRGYAQKVVADLTNAEKPLKRLSAIIRGIVDVHDWQPWRGVFAETPQPMTVSTSKETNTQLWLLKSCAPALAKLMIEDPKWVQSFMTHCEELSHEYQNSNLTAKVHIL